MEALYSKLYEKYTKLKTKKESELEKLNRDQEVKFMTYVSAADELIEHLRSDNDRLHAQANDLRSEVTSIRSTKNEQYADYQKILMEENQKNKELSEEIERLRNLQRQGLCCSYRDDNVEHGLLNTPRGSQFGSDAPSGLVVMTRKRSRLSGIEKEVTVTPCASDQVEHAPVRESANKLSKPTLFSGTLLGIDQPKCCRRKIGYSGDVNVTGPTSCMFQELFECLVGMKLSIVTQTDEVHISAVHQSSGYSFSLTWINNPLGEAELLYRVLSLGTFERVAPEWMREVLMFSTRMCPIFFERVSHIVKFHH